MSAYQTKYHFKVDGKRTMISVDNYLSKMYAAKLKIEGVENGQQSPELRKEIQKLVDHRPVDSHVSQHVRMSMLFQVAQPKLVAAAIKQKEIEL